MSGEADAAGLPERILLVFAKAPDPGRVKTRLARELGEEPAARIYRTLGRRVVDALRGGAYRVIVYFDPPDAEHRIRTWLGGGIELLGQPPGTLGERLAHAFEWGCARAGTVCVVGTDIPGLDRTVVEAAFEALEAPGGTDAVFGPAEDGGYYLLALARPAPALFRNIAWSTDRVLAESVERAQQEGLAVEIGIRLADVDYAADIPDSLRRELGLERARGGPGRSSRPAPGGGDGGG